MARDCVAFFYKRREAMPYEKDKVIDVIAVLTIMKRDFTGTFNREITELRKVAIDEVAKAELITGRYENIDSAKKDYSRCMHASFEA